MPSLRAGIRAGYSRRSVARTGDAEVSPSRRSRARRACGVLFTYSCTYSLRDFARVRRQVRPRAVDVTAGQARVEAVDRDVFRDLRRAAVKQRTFRCFTMAEVERCQKVDRPRDHEAAAVYMRHTHTHTHVVFVFRFRVRVVSVFFSAVFRFRFRSRVFSLVVWGLI